MTGWIELAVYVVGYLTCARVVFRWTDRDKRVFPGAESRSDAAFVAVVVSIFWPLILAAGLALSPFFVIGWLISMPTRADRRAAMDSSTRELAAKYDLPDPRP